jgi:flagellar hook-associated protein 2
VGVSAGAAAAGRHEIIVQELARAQVTATASTVPDADATIVASGGTITIGGVTVSINGNVTLQQLASAINSTAGVGARASVVRTAPNEYRLVLTGATTGTASAFTVTNNLTGGAGIAFTDTDGNGTSGDSAADNAANAADALVVINGMTVTSGSNVLDGVIPDITLTAYEADPTRTIVIDVVRDDEAAQAHVESFIEAYNALVEMFDDQRSAAVRGDPASLGRDPLLRHLRSRLRAVMLGAHGSGTLTRLAEAGVTVTSSGTLKLDATQFRAALAQSPTDVATLFTSAFTEVHSLLGEYGQASGLISSTRDRLNDQIRAMDRQIGSMQARLALQRESLQREFAAADAIMSRLRSQAGSIASFSAGFGAF